MLEEGDSFANTVVQTTNTVFTNKAFDDGAAYPNEPDGYLNAKPVGWYRNGDIGQYW